MKNLPSQSLIFLGLSLTIIIQSAKAAYPAYDWSSVPGGWVYTNNGDQAICGPGGVADSLDGTWNRNNGSSEWDCSGLGGTLKSGLNAPGGVIAVTTGTHPSEVGISYLRIQDCGNPEQFKDPSNVTFTRPANRKILFVHDMTAEGCPDTVLDDGFTITFRARIPTRAKTTAPIDDLYPAGEAGNGVVTYPAAGDGILIRDNANGCVSARQLSPSSKIGFSLVTSNDSTSGFVGGTKANFMGFEVNGLNGNVPNNNVDFGVAPTQYLPLDPTEWNEFWIVVTKDDSGLGTHLLLVYTNGSTSAQIFHVTAASSGGELSSVSHIEMGSSQTAQSGAVDIDFLAYKFAAVFPPGAGGAPPTILNVSPTPPASGNVFWPVASGVSFSANASAGKTIGNSGIVLVLNGVDVSASLAITGGGTANVSATYNGLLANTIYTGTIQVTDSAGAKATFPLRFDTFTTASSIVADAEDYNYSMGLFYDNSAPNFYGLSAGTEGVDYHKLTPGTDVNSTHHAYRPGDAVSTVTSADSARAAFTSASATDYDVADIEQGEWQNYTRTFAAGKYAVYLRYFAVVSQSVRLERVTSDRTLPNQTTDFLGTFPVASGSSYNYVQLVDGSGNPLVLNLSGVTTLRLTAPDASLNLALNYLVFAPSAAANLPPVVGYAAPAGNSTTFLPDGKIQIAIVNRDTAVVPASINYRLDGTDVTGSSTIASTPSGALVTYQPPGQLVLNSLHTNRVVFTNNAGTPVSFTNQWSFRVANLPVLVSSWATAPGSGSNPGFTGLIHKHDNAQSLLFPNNAIRAESQVGGTLIDGTTGQPFTNDIPGPNGDGTFTTTGVINYSYDGTDRAYFTGDQIFPYLDTDPSGTYAHIAMSVTTYLDLPAGLVRFGSRRNDGFKLSSGFHFSRNAATLQLGILESANNDNGTGTTEFDFVVPTAGVYPFRLIFFQNTGLCDLEWYSVNRTTGARTLINSATPGSVKAYMTRPNLPLTPQKILNPRITGTNILFEYQTLFGYNYYVDYKDVVTGSWTLGATPTAGDGSILTFSAPANASARQFLRIRAQ